jgi:hypothetical protein
VRLRATVNNRKKDKMKNYNIVRLASALTALAIFSAGSAPAESLRIQAPTVLPRNHGLGDYSPWVSFSYADLKSEPYTLKVWLLEEEHWYCASSQWCERTFAINSHREGPANGSLQMTSPFDVFDYGPSLTWVARLFNGSGVEVASAKVQSRTVAAESPTLRPVGKRVRAVGQELRMVFSATAAVGEKAIFRVHGAPADAKLDAETGVFTWTPSAPGLYRVVVEAVSDKTKLTDAEIVSLDITQAEEAPTPLQARPGQ